VLDGFAYRYKLLEQGTRQILALHIPGDFCDIYSFVVKPMDHGIAAASPCRVAKVPHTVIHDLTETQPRLARMFWWDTAIDAAVTRQWMISMGRRPAYRQVAHLLCELFVRMKAVDLVEGDSYELPITQAELGDIFGLSIVQVNRTLQELRTDGLVVSEGKRVTIPDPAALTEAAGFNPDYLHMRAGPM
jgi:CRP-like cAMP-binding protein